MNEEALQHCAVMVTGGNLISSCTNTESYQSLDMTTLEFPASCSAQKHLVRDPSRLNETQ